MGTNGRAILRDNGKRLLFSSGIGALFNAQGVCPDYCYDAFRLQWSFCDEGFIDGGQNGAARTYDDPSEVSASPWTIFNEGFKIRLDFEDDDNCMNHNPYIQSAQAFCKIIVPQTMIMTISWAGEGETESTFGEQMRIYLNRYNLITSAHSPGGQLGCAGGMAPIVSTPAPPQQRSLWRGQHELLVTASTNSNMYHFGAWYEWDISFTPA